MGGVKAKKGAKSGGGRSERPRGQRFAEALAALRERAAALGLEEPVDVTGELVAWRRAQPAEPEVLHLEEWRPSS